MTLAYLLLAATAPAPEVFHLKTPNFSIPIRVKPEDRPAIRELRLYCSTDEGQTWQVVASARPDEAAFTFVAPKDGIYWFTVAVISPQGQQDPVDVKRAPVGQRTVVDTTPPAIQLTAERRGDEVVAAWTCTEDYPVPETLRLEYHTPDLPPDQWVPVGVTPGPTGQSTFKPASGSPLSVRMSLQDRAGNKGLASAELAAAAGGPPIRPVGILAETAQPGLKDPLPPVYPGALSGATAGQGMGDRLSDAGKPQQVEPAFRPQQGAGGPVPLKMVSGEGAGMQPIAHSDGGAEKHEPEPPPQPPAPAQGAAVPPVQIVNKRQVKLEFEVSQFGPSGLGGVEVYQTLDEGQHWEQVHIDPATTILPLPADGKGLPVRGSVLVPLTREGVVHGFVLVVKSRANRGKAPPHLGDVPEARVELDTLAPEIKLFAPTPDPNRRDGLVLSWVAQDKNLGPNPVTLEWAERPAGPWNVIGQADMPNTGTHTWQVPGNAPPSVYLRLTVKDLAGNVSVAVTKDPQLIDLTEPVSKIIGVNPGGMR
jgi:hypothetical protein